MNRTATKVLWWSSWLVFGIFLPGAPGAESGKSFPIWEDVDGRELEARIIRKEEGVVVMRRVDGQEFEIPIRRFSEESRKRIGEWSPPPIEVPEPDEAVLVLETDEGVGSGFLVQENGRVWVYTNRHVIGSARDLTATDVSGKEIELGELEVVKDLDLARFATKERRGLELGGSLSTGQEIAVYGNSQGSGVITRSEGQVLGLSADALEVSSEIVSGNSGGPVLDEEGRVLGVSTFVTTGWSGDPTMIGTRYVEPRRFALRLDRDMEFSSVQREAYAELYDEFSEQSDQFDEAFELFREILRGPTNRIPLSNYSVEDVADIAEDHNRDMARLPLGYRSENERKNALRRMKSLVVDTLEDTFEVGQESMEMMEKMTEDGRPGAVMAYELTRRKKILEGWKETLGKAEEFFDD